MMRAFSVVCALTLAVVVTACGDDAGGSETRAGESAVTVTNAYSPVSPNPDIGAVYLTIANGTETDDRLIGAASAAAGTVEVHRSYTDADGRAVMEHEPDLAVPSGETVLFEPGGLHVMLMGVIEPLEAGDTIDLELEFAEAGTLAVEAEVVPFAADQHGDDSMDHDHHDHDQDDHDDATDHAHDEHDHG